MEGWLWLIFRLCRTCSKISPHGLTAKNPDSTDAFSEMRGVMTICAVLEIKRFLRKKTHQKSASNELF